MSVFAPKRRLQHLSPGQGLDQHRIGDHVRARNVDRRSESDCARGESGGLRRARQELELGYLYIGDEITALAQYNLTPIGGRPTVHELVEQIQPIGEARTDARAVFSAISNGPPELLFPFTMQVFGDDIDTLVAAAETMQADLDGRTLELGNGDEFQCRDRCGARRRRRSRGRTPTRRGACSVRQRFGNEHNSGRRGLLRRELRRYGPGGTRPRRRRPRIRLRPRVATTRSRSARCPSPSSSRWF